MATKGINKLIAKSKSFFGSNSSSTVKDPRELSSASREREKHLQSKLESLLSDIEYSPDFKLSKEKIAEFKIPLRLSKMIKSLETPLVTETDESSLDAMIESFVDALRKALRLGYENSAYWSSLALHHSLECLHVAVDEYDKEFSELLYARKLEYAQTLNSIIRNANTLDEMDQAISADEKAYNRWIKELHELKDEYNAMKTSDRGRDLINRTRLKAANPSEMSPDELDLFNRLQRIRDLKKLLGDKTSIRNANLKTYRTASMAIQQLNDQLRQKPTVTDEKLAATMAAVNNRFLKHLDDRISTTLDIERTMDDYSVKLKETVKRIEKASALEINETIDNLDVEAVEASLARRESKEMAARIAANQRELQRQEELIKNFSQEIEAEQQAEVVTHTEVEEEQETETEVEQVYETEFECG